MALVLVEGEGQIADILKATNVSTTAQAPAASTTTVNASASQLVTDADRTAIIALIAGFAMVHILLS